MFLKKLRGINLKKLWDAKKKRKELIKTLDTKDIIKYGLDQKNAADTLEKRLLHIYVVGMIRFDVSTIDKFQRQQLAKAESKRLKLKLCLDRKIMFKTWMTEAAKHKGETPGVASIYYETAGLYLTFLKGR